MSTGVHAQGEQGPKGDDALCVYLENPTVNIPCDADGNTKPSNQVVPVCYTAFRGGERIAASSEFAGYTYMNPKQMSPNEIYGFEINPATATQHGTIGFRFTEGVSPFWTLHQTDMLTLYIGITVEGSEMALPLQFVRVRDGETPELSVQDVQVNGVSVLDAQGVANVPVATTSTGGLGVVQPFVNSFVVDSAGQLRIAFAAYSHVKEGTNDYRPITSAKEHAAAFYGFAKAAGSDEKNSTLPVGQYTESAKSAISQMLNSPVSVTGTTPTITALSGIQYVCGEVSTLDITLPESGIVDVVFQSGSTPTVLTITPPTGMTVEWANGFDSTALESDTLYELNIKMVGTKCLGVAGAWS